MMDEDRKEHVDMTGGSGKKKVNDIVINRTCYRPWKQTYLQVVSESKEKVLMKNKLTNGHPNGEPDPGCN